MSELTPILWDTLDKLFTSPEHEALLEDLLDDEDGDKVTLFLRESLPEGHTKEDYEAALKGIEELAWFVTDDVEQELISFEEILTEYPILRGFFDEESTRTLIHSFRGKDKIRYNQVDYFLGVYLLGKAEELQNPGFRVVDKLYENV